ncbi:MAG: RidA family protein [Armatimonadetes bacterium]|nr:RidA family protein [Armatimonadota bacterium]
MRREVHSTDQAPSAIGPYSQAVKAEGRFMFLSGQIPLLPDGTLVEGTIEEQTEQVMKNLEAVLTSAGLSFGNVVKTTILLSSMDHFAAVNEIYGARFPDDPPARATYATAGLPKDVDIEIEAIAVY